MEEKWKRRPSTHTQGNKIALLGKWSSIIMLMVRQWNYHQFEDEQEVEDKVLDYHCHKGKKNSCPFYLFPPIHPKS